MKPSEAKPEIIYRVIDRKSGRLQGAYSRAYCDEFDFSSYEEARTARFDDEFKLPQYKISKFRVIYQLIEDDCHETK